MRRLSLVLLGVGLATSVFAQDKSMPTVSSMQAERDQWHLYADQVVVSRATVEQSLAVCTYQKDRATDELARLQARIADLEKTLKAAKPATP